MRIGRTAAAALTLVLLAAGAPAADDPGAALKADVDALVKMLEDRWGGRDDDGPSPTVRVNRLVAAGDAKLRPVLAEAWKVVTTCPAGERYRNPTRQLVRFLYSLTETGKAAAQGDDEITEEDGIVRIRKGDAVGNFGWKGWSGGGFGRKNDESAPPFAEVVKGGKLRKIAKPDVRKALAALDGGKVAENERICVAKAIGEGCATNKPGLQDLLKRFDSDPANQWLMTALAWSGSAEAEPPLRMEIEGLAGRVADGREAAARILATACWALKRIRRDALVEEAGKVTGAPREALLAAAGMDFATTLDLASLAQAPDAAAKRAALAALCARLTATQGDGRASGATLTELTKLLASNVATADETLRASILEAAETLFYAYNRYPVGGGESAGVGGADTHVKTTGERLGAYPDMATLLAWMDRDVAKGDLVFVDSRETPLFDLTAGGDRIGGKPLWSDVKCPDPAAGDGSPDERADVKITGAIVADGLRLTLTNVGSTVICVNPVALRYGTAELTKTESASGGGAASYRQLKLVLGFIRAGVATPGDRLVSLAPKMEYSWTAPVRARHREVDHVCVEMYDGFAVRGRPPAPPLDSFWDTWVK